MSACFGSRVSALSIALEFALLLLALAYAGTYALPDLRWLLDGDLEGQRALAASAHAREAAAHAHESHAHAFLLTAHAREAAASAMAMAAGDGEKLLITSPGSPIT